MDTDDLVAPVVIPLADGNRLSLRPGSLVVTDRAGAVITRVETRDITGVNRGGKDIILTRRQTDPVVLIAATVADAERILSLLCERRGEAERFKRRWGWRRG